MNQQYIHENTSVHLINYHFVWCPKRRRKVLINEIKKDLKKLLYMKTEELKLRIIQMEIMPDHIHLFVQSHTQTSPHLITRHLKGFTSYHLRKKHKELLKLPSMWIRSYFVSTAGNVSSKTINEYIKNQSKK